MKKIEIPKRIVNPETKIPSMKFTSFIFLAFSFILLNFIALKNKKYLVLNF